MRVSLVLGSAGYLGQKVCERLGSEFGSDTVFGIDVANGQFDIDLTAEYSFIEVLNARQSRIPIDGLILVNCAGTTVFTPTDERKIEEITEVSSSQLGISVLALNRFVELCRSLGVQGSAILVSSIFARKVPRFSNYENLARRSAEIYGATKAGVEQLTRYYASLYGREGIRVNCVAPGGILDPKVHAPSFQKAYSELTSLGRMTTLSEVVEVIVFLASDRSSGMTGAIIPVDCGYGL